MLILLLDPSNSGRIKPHYFPGPGAGKLCKQPREKAAESHSHGVGGTPGGPGGVGGTQGVPGVHPPPLIGDEAVPGYQRHKTPQEGRSYSDPQNVFICVSSVDPLFFIPDIWFKCHYSASMGVRCGFANFWPRRTAKPRRLQRGPTTLRASWVRKAARRGGRETLVNRNLA